MGLRFETLRRARGGQEQWWRYGAGGLAAWSYLTGSSSVGEEVVRVVDEVVEHGVAITHVDRLIGDPERFPAVRHHVARLQGRHADVIDAARLEEGEQRQVSLTGEHPTLDPDDPVVSLLLRSELADVAGHFYRMAPRLLECKVWQTIANGSEPARTQRWHRDRPGDRHILKCFVYLNDVTEACGPFCFAPDTHERGHLEPDAARELDALRCIDGNVHRFADDIESVVDVVRCTGRVGTIVFADTTGLHMGGRSVFGERLMITAQYGSAAAWQRPYFDVGTAPADRTTAYALGVSPPPRARHLRQRRAEARDAQQSPSTRHTPSRRTT